MKSLNEINYFQIIIFFLLFFFFNDSWMMIWTEPRETFEEKNIKFIKKGSR